MLNPSDKELDRLSREAADHYEPDEQISSWEQLVPRLDREIGVKPNAGFRIFGRGSALFAVAVITITGIFFFVMKQRQPVNADLHTKTEKSLPVTDKGTDHTPQTDHASKPENEIRSENPAGNSQQSNSIDASRNDNEKAPMPTSKSNAGNENSDTSNNNSSNKAEKELLQPDASRSAQNQASSPLHSDSRSGTKLVAGVIVGASAASNANAPVLNNSSPKSGMSKSNQNQAAQGASNANSGLNEDLKVVDFALISPAFQTGAVSTNFTLKSSSNVNVQLSKEAIEQSKNTQRALRINRALKIGILYGSDVTSVHSVAPDKLSQGWGMTLGYQFHDHWSINTGVIYTQKNYSAEGKDFHLKSTNTWPSWGKLDYVDGNCNMWEIPLTIRYDFDRINNTTLFINAGASSYLMRHESYKYYGHTYYSGTATPWQSPNPIPYNTKENYLFSVIDFSLGVEQKLGKSLSFQVEPYVKIPVQGVGIGSVDLSSYGVNLSLRFAPLLKSSRN
jgi:hypothetical protein